MKALDPEKPGKADLRLPAETLPIILWAHTLKPDEAAPHGLFRSEPATRRDPLGGQAGLGEQLAGCLNAQLLDRAARRQAGRFVVAAQEGPLAHARLRGKRGIRIDPSARCSASHACKSAKRSSADCSESAALN